MSFLDSEKLELNATARRLGEDLPFPELDTSSDVKEGQELEIFGANYETRKGFIKI